MKYIYIALLATCFVACKKDEEAVRTSSIINVVNVINGETNIKVNPSGKNIGFNRISEQVAFGAGRLYNANVGSRTLVAVSALDTTVTLFKRIVNFVPGIYTLYLGGQVTNIDTMFIKESNYPMIKTDITRPTSADSVVNIRFVNLCSNSPSLKINLKNYTSNEVENSTYKDIGKWKAYPSKLNNTFYEFEIRDAQSNSILLTYNFIANSDNRFRNVSLVIRGLVDGNGANAFAVSPINYY